MIRTGNEKLGNQIMVLPVAKETVLTENTIAVLNEDGYAETATAKKDVLVVGRIEKFCDNHAGVDGEVSTEAKRGTFVWENDGTIEETDIMKKCYIKDDVTVTMTSADSSVAGTILAVDADGVTVDMTAV